MDAAKFAADVVDEVPGVGSLADCLEARDTQPVMPPEALEPLRGEGRAAGVGGPFSLLGIKYSLLSDNVGFFCVGQKNNVMLRTGRIQCAEQSQSTHRKIDVVNLIDVNIFD